MKPDRLAFNPNHEAFHASVKVGLEDDNHCEEDHTSRIPDENAMDIMADLVPQCFHDV